MADSEAQRDSWCQQAWRWNLDVVIDMHDDAMVYYWDKESNSYGRNVNPETGTSTATPYDQGGYLKRIEYGLRSNTMYSAKAAAKIDLTHSERCLSDCGTFDKAHAKNWPDVPFDRYCDSGTECKDRYTPSFWSRKRLTGIATSVLTGGAYKPVDTWKLGHSFPATGDGSDPALWLTSVTRTGHTGTGDVSLPAVNFKGLTLPNRVEGATTGGQPDPIPPMWRYRIYGIDTESGGSLGITYSPTDCKAGSVPTPESNNRRCYPVKWSPPDAPGAEYEPYLDWFHSYVVTQILENPNTTGAVAKQTEYSYLDGMAWAKSKDDEFTDAKHLTYSDRKGYGRVQVRTGAAPEKRTLQEFRYFRGIDGASVKDQEGVSVTDKEPFAGMTRELAVYNGDGGKLESTTSYEPWLSAATATEKRPENLPDRKAYATGGKSEQTRTAVGAGWRTTKVERTLDDVGQVLTESALGYVAKSGDEECTTTTYARNTGNNILNLVAESKTVAKPCGTAPKLPDDLVSAERHYYDNATSPTAAPVRRPTRWGGAAAFPRRPARGRTPMGPGGAAALGRMSPKSGLQRWSLRLATTVAVLLWEGRLPLLYGVSGRQLLLHWQGLGGCCTNRPDITADEGPSGSRLFGHGSCQTNRCCGHVRRCFAGTALAVAPSASATSYNGCDYPRVCFNQTQPDWSIGMPNAAYQNLSSRADWAYNSRNDDRAMLCFTYGGSTYYKCLPPNGTIQFSSASTVTGIRIDTASAC